MRRVAEEPDGIRTFDDHDVVLPSNLDGYEFRDAPGISQRVDDVLGGQFSHDQCQVAFEGGLDRASIDPLHIFCGASTTNHSHHAFKRHHTRIVHRAKYERRTCSRLAQESALVLKL
jgi:hypothetical protein